MRRRPSGRHRRTRVRRLDLAILERIASEGGRPKSAVTRTMEHNTHPVDREEVMALLDGELDATRAATVRAHVDGCAECRALADELHAAGARMSAWQIETSPPSLEKSVMSAATASLKSSTVLPAAPEPRPRTRRVIWQLAAVSAVLLVVVAISVPNLLRSRIAAVKSVHTFEEIPSPAPSLPSQGSLGSLSRKGQAYRPEASPMSGPMVIRTASLTLLTKEFDRARTAIQQIVAKRGGFLGQLTVSGEDNTGRTLTAVLRVPSSQLDASLAELKPLGRVTQESQSGEEITQPYTDLIARLSNARATEKRLVEVLAQRTGKVADVLEVELEIARVRGQIESMEAQRRSLEKQVQFATVQLRVTEDFKQSLEVTPPSTGTMLWNALADGFRSAVDTVLGVAEFLLRTGPSLLVWAVILWWPASVAFRRIRAAMQFTVAR